MSSEWWVYIVECSDGSYYTGVSTDVERRVDQHNEGTRAAAYTRSRRPVELRHVEGPGDKSWALSREYEIKQLTHDGKEGIIDAGCADLLVEGDVPLDQGPLSS